MVHRDAVLNYVKGRGPLLPSEMKQALGSDTTILGAILSELAAAKLVKITHTKRGGSPFYFAPGQEAKLEQIQQFLNEKDRRTVEKLKRERIIRDKGQDPLTRVSLRNIKDFAIPFETEYLGLKELFWKYYLASSEEVSQVTQRIKQIGKQSVIQERPQQTIQRDQPIRQDPIVQRTVIQEKEIVRPQPVIEREEKKIVIPKQQTLAPEEKKPEGSFWEELEQYFKKNRIKVIEQKIVRKNSDYEFLLEIPSAVGNLVYFCKAKRKKKTNDGDLSSVYLHANGKKLPALYLTTGELTKKANQFIKGELKSVTVKKL